MILANPLWWPLRNEVACTVKHHSSNVSQERQNTVANRQVTRTVARCNTALCYYYHVSHFTWSIVGKNESVFFLKFNQLCKLNRCLSQGEIYHQCNICHLSLTSDSENKSIRGLEVRVKRKRLMIRYVN